MPSENKGKKGSLRNERTVSYSLLSCLEMFRQLNVVLSFANEYSQVNLCHFFGPPSFTLCKSNKICMEKLP